MSSWASICDAWITELTDIPELANPITHKYAPWSLEQLSATGTERHLAVWPAADAETAAGFVTGPSSNLVQSFLATIWEGVRDTDRLRDDDAANLAWLTLGEDVRDRFLTKANIRLGGDDIMITRYDGITLPAHAGLRVIVAAFTCEVPRMHT